MTNAVVRMDGRRAGGPHRCRALEDHLTPRRELITCVTGTRATGFRKANGCSAVRSKSCSRRPRGLAPGAAAATEKGIDLGDRGMLLWSNVDNGVVPLDVASVKSKFGSFAGCFAAGLPRHACRADRRTTHAPNADGMHISPRLWNMRRPGRLRECRARLKYSSSSSKS